MESTASCSWGARLPPLHCRQLQISSPFLSWFGRQQLDPGSCPCHRPTVIRETVSRLSEHKRRWEPCWRFRYLRVTTVHPASLNASRGPGGELIKQESLPRYSSWSVSSSSSVQQVSSSFGVFVLLQVVVPCFARAQPCGVPNPSADEANQAFSLAFGLSSTLAFAFCLFP